MRMDVRLSNGTNCLRMFSPWPLIFRALAPFFMRLGPFILDAAVHPSFAGLLGSSWFAMVHQVRTSLKEQMPIPAFTIGTETQVMRLSRDLVQDLDCLLKELAILLATLSRPHEATGSIHEQDGPPT